MRRPKGRSSFSALYAMHMNITNKPQPVIAWGILIGTCLGLMESVTSVRMWNLFDQPDFFYRGNGDHERLSIITVVGGVIVGFSYGYIIHEWRGRILKRARLYGLYLRMMALGILTYIFLYWMTYRFRWPACFVADPLLFIAGLILAHRYSSTKDTQHGDR